LKKENNILFIGAEKSSLHFIKSILDSLPENFDFPIFICIPYVKANKVNFINYLSSDNNHKIVNPKADEIIENGKIYVAAPFVHTFLTSNKTFYLSREYTKYYHQPSIDLSLLSFIEQFQQNITAIVFPNSLKEGIFGLKKLKSVNGKVLICNNQDSKINCDCSCYTEIIGGDNCYDINQIINCLSKNIQYAEY